MLFGAVFAFIEGRLLFSGDINLYSNAGWGYFVAIAKLVAALFSMAFGVLTFFNISKKDRPNLEIFIYAFSLAIFVIVEVYSEEVSVSSGPTPLYISLPLRLIGAGVFLGAILQFLGNNKQDTASKDSSSKN